MRLIAVASTALATLAFTLPAHALAPHETCHMVTTCTWVPASCTPKPQAPAPCPQGTTKPHKVCSTEKVCH